MKRKFVVMMLAVAMLLAMPLVTVTIADIGAGGSSWNVVSDNYVVSAKSKRPYKDVKKKEVGDINYKAIKELKGFGTYVGDNKIKKRKFHPFSYLTKKQWMGWMIHTYGEKVVFVDSGDMTNDAATLGFIKKKMKQTAEKGYGISGVNWPRDTNPDSMKVKRYLGSGYLWEFEDFFKLQECTPIVQTSYLERSSELLGLFLWFSGCIFRLDRNSRRARWR